jgi:V/A-type H+-transporting ATPase subunit I
MEGASLVLRAEPMTRVLLVVPREHVPGAMEALYDMRILHVHDHMEGRDGLALGKPLDGASETSEMLIRLRAMIATLGIKGQEVESPLPVNTVMRELEEKFEHLEEQIDTLGDNRSRLTNESRNIEQRLTVLEPYLHLGLDLSHYNEYESVEVIVGSVTGDINKALGRTQVRHELFLPKDPSKSSTFALFVDKDRADEVRTMLQEMNFQPAPVFEGEGDPRSMRVQLKEGLAKVKSNLEEVELNLKRIREVHGDSLLAAEEQLSINVEKLESPLRCGSTANVLFTEGWVPKNKISDLELGLRKAIQDNYHIEVLTDEDVLEGHTKPVAADGGEPDGSEADDHDDIDPVAETPVMLRNPKHVQVHEDLIELVSRPRYDEVDPALFMFITFPIMFGMMVGDLGYGVTFMFAGWWLLRLESPKGWFGMKWKGVGITEGAARTRMIKMIMFSGFVTAIWGFLYGEAYGFELYGTHGIFTHESLYVVPLDLWLPISRLEEASFMLELCIYIGVIHLLLGLTIGFFNEKGRHGTGHAFLAKGSWMLIIIGGMMFFVVFLASDTVDWGDTTLLTGAGIMVLGIVLLLAGEGMFGVLELPSILSNILSYTRLFAIGLSSLGIALAFNSIVADMWAAGIAGMIGGAIIFFLGHLVNLFLALLAPSLHALRLHYVEWMTKFFEGGGVPYEPFGRERVYTEV